MQFVSEAFLRALCGLRRRFGRVGRFGSDAVQIVVKRFRAGGKEFSCLPDSETAQVRGSTGLRGKEIASLVSAANPLDG
jgi:hypothetical protein